MRVARLMDHILVPLEHEWLKGKSEADGLGRVKSLRAAILPDMVAEKIDEAERRRWWQQLSDIYLAQQRLNYPPDYFNPTPTGEKLLETVERFEEDLTDKARIHQPIHAAIEVGEAIEVPPGRDRGVQGDSIMTRYASRSRRCWRACVLAVPGRRTVSRGWKRLARMPTTRQLDAQPVCAASIPRRSLTVAISSPPTTKNRITVATPAR